MSFSSIQLHTVPDRISGTHKRFYLSPLLHPSSLWSCKSRESLISLVGCLNGLNARRFDFSEFEVSCLGTLQLPYGGPPRS